MRGDSLEGSCPRPSFIGGLKKRRNRYLAVSGFEAWPCLDGLVGDGLRVSRPRPIVYRSDLIIDESEMVVSGGEKAPGRIETDLGRR